MRQVDLIASAPSVIAAARKGTATSRAPRPARCRRSPRSRNVQGDALAAGRLRPPARSSLDLLPKLDIAEVMLTDQYGYNAVTTSPSSDFVQSDEGWWQTAWTAGVDRRRKRPTTRRRSDTVVELARAVRDRRHARRRREGEVRSLDARLRARQGSGVGTSLRVDLVDSVGQVIASSAGGALQAARRRRRTLAGTTAPTASSTFGTDRRSAARRPWRTPTTAAGASSRTCAEADASRRTTMRALVAARRRRRRCSRSCWSRSSSSSRFDRAAHHRSGRGAGDRRRSGRGRRSLEARRTTPTTDDEIGRLGARRRGDDRRAAASRDGALGSSAQRDGSDDGRDHRQLRGDGGVGRPDRAHRVRLSAAVDDDGRRRSSRSPMSSENLVGVASELDAGAHEGVERNAQLRALALENRARLDDSSRSLATLSDDVEASAAAIEAAGAGVGRSSELRDARAEARAAVEAPRAQRGDGSGARRRARPRLRRRREEVRRLAAMSSDAAERTEQVVGGVLRGIDAVARFERAHGGHGARGARRDASKASRSFGQIEKAVAEADAWTTSIERAATAANTLGRTSITKRSTRSRRARSRSPRRCRRSPRRARSRARAREEIAAAAATLSARPSISAARGEPATRGGRRERRRPDEPVARAGTGAPERRRRLPESRYGVGPFRSGPPVTISAGN